MYNIEKNHDHLLVTFEEDFNFCMIQTIIHHLTGTKEYPDTNDIWIIGAHRADIRLGELELMVKEFKCRCPRDATRTKTAIVAEQGLTQAIIELWANALKKQVAFEIRIFSELEEAKEWMAVAHSMVA
jgi:hypothetical protein